MDESSTARRLATEGSARPTRDLATDAQIAPAGSGRADSLTSGTMVGAYRLVRPLGAGAHGTVWLARSSGRLAGNVALKILRVGARSEDLTRLEREAAVLARLDHPNLLRVIDLVDDANRPALVTEFAAGGSLADRVAGGALDPRAAVRLLLPISRALDSTHRHGLVHGDVKPSNILLTSGDEPLLADFGLSGWLGAIAAVEGTAGHLAPERYAGGPPSVRSDVFALGVTAFELLVGDRPIDPGWDDPLLDLPVSNSLARAVSRAMDRDSASRVEGAAAFAELLARTPEAQPIGALVGPDHLADSSGVPSARPAAGALSSRSMSSARDGREQQEIAGAAPAEASLTRRFGPAPPILDVEGPLSYGPAVRIAAIVAVVGIVTIAVALTAGF